MKRIKENNRVRKAAESRTWSRVSRSSAGEAFEDQDVRKVSAAREKAPQESDTLKSPG